MLVVVFFFFSSRRRHTRFDCDWSSDVCSSDLLGALVDGLHRGDFDLIGRSLVDTVAEPRRALLVPGLAAIKRSEEHTSELQSQSNLVCRLLLEKKKKKKNRNNIRSDQGE